MAKKAVTLTSRQRAKVVSKVVVKEFLTHASVAKATEVMKDKFNDLDKYLTQEKINMAKIRQKFPSNQAEQPKISWRSLKRTTANAYGKIKTFKIKGVYSDVRGKVTEYSQQARSEFQEGADASQNNGPRKNQFTNSAQCDNNQQVHSESKEASPESALSESRETSSHNQRSADLFNLDYGSRQAKSAFEDIFLKDKGSNSMFSNFKKRMFLKIAFFFGFLVFCHSFAKNLALSIGRNKSIEQFIKSQNVIRESQGLPPVNLQSSQ